MGMSLRLRQLALALTIVFSLDGAHSVCRRMTLKSNKHGYNRLTVNEAAHVTSITPEKVFSNSACVPGVGYGHFGTEIWVNKGCRAEFKVCFTHGANAEVTCSSKGHGHKACHAPANVSSVVVKKQYSKAPCIHGVSYRIVGPSLEVLNGCRATFVIGHTPHTN
ncbi:D-galacturonic acid binding lectin [Elysia marginata]|uniref:D-galacturonic acid binding lectin n=1 Tax=Elysia marginata TaxID=1093978 RepID=A0AAV4GJN1_9GAST|nr:D-galacturonic acid binding lectin [Elysia marginata]